MVVCSRASNEEIYETFQRKKQHLKSFAIGRGGGATVGWCVCVDVGGGEGVEHFHVG